MPPSAPRGVPGDAGRILAGNPRPGERRPGRHDHGQDEAKSMIVARMWQYLFHSGLDHENGSKLATIMMPDRARAA
jgi:hypothetical protein